MRTKTRQIRTKTAEMRTISLKKHPKIVGEYTFLTHLRQTIANLIEIVHSLLRFTYLKRFLCFEVMNQIHRQP